MYAVIMSGGKQYRVEEGGVVRVEELGLDPGSEVEFKDVLLVRTGDETYVGQPLIEGAIVKGTVEKAGKGDKVIVLKYKRKKQYRRTRGHRQAYAEVRVEKIELGARPAA